MFDRSLTPARTPGGACIMRKLHQLTADLGPGSDGAEDLLRVWRQGRRLHPMVQARVSFQAGAREHYGQQHQLASAELV